MTNTIIKGREHLLTALGVFLKILCIILCVSTVEPPNNGHIVLFLWQSQSGARCLSVVWRLSVSWSVRYGRFHCTCKEGGREGEIDKPAISEVSFQSIAETARAFHKHLLVSVQRLYRTAENKKKTL